MYRLAMSCIFSELIRSSRLFLVEDNCFQIDPKTSLACEKMKNLGLDAFLLIMKEINKNIYLASRNLASLSVLNVCFINPVVLISSRRVVLTQSALLHIKGWLK
jgi:large subunit ribosomal protein L4